MSNENEAFEQALNYSILETECLLTCDEDAINEVALIMWNSAKADSAQEIAKLKEQLTIAYMVGELDKKSEILKLQAHINELREALEKLAKLGNGEHYGNSEGNVIAQQALAKTPAQSLQAHDDEVIERCAKVCDDNAILNRKFAEPFAAKVSELNADAIRALKTGEE